MFDNDLPIKAEPLSDAIELMRSVWAVDHAARRLSKTMEKHLGVSGPQRMILRVVGQQPGISAAPLAELLHIDASTLSGHLQRLEELTLIERRVDRDDARRVSLRLTASGRRLNVATPGTVEAAVESALSKVPPGSQHEVADFLSRLEAQLNAQAAACEAAANRPKRRRLR